MALETLVSAHSRNCYSEWVTMEGDGGTSNYTIAKTAGGSWYLSIPSARLREADVPRRQGKVASRMDHRVFCATRRKAVSVGLARQADLGFTRIAGKAVCTRIKRQAGENPH